MEKSPPKKILIFSMAYYPWVGGAEVAIAEITDRIDPSDIEFHMVTLRFDRALPKVEKVGNVLVHRIGFTKRSPGMSDLGKFPLHLNKLFFQFFGALKASKLHRQHNYDSIWAMMAHSSGVPAGIFKSSHPDVSYILTLQEGDPTRHIKKKMRIFGKLFYNAFSKADKVQAISHFLGKWARNMGYGGELKIIPNAVDIGYFSQKYSDAEISELKNKLDKKKGDIFIITTSRLVKKNAVDDVIESLEHLSENMKFLIIGIGPDEKTLKSLTKKLNLSNRVKFLGEIDNKYLPKYLKVSDIFATDIFARPSRSEGMGISFVEAMAAGLPVIATQEGGISDFLFDSKRNPDQKTTGWAVDKDSPEQIAEAIKDIMRNPKKTKEVINTARNLVFKKYDWDIVARDMKNKVFKSFPAT